MKQKSGILLNGSRKMGSLTLTYRILKSEKLDLVSIT